MFTGIIEEIGYLRNIKKASASAILSIKCSQILSDIHLGDSIAVNGVCLTVTGFDEDGFTADVMHETLRRSSLGELKAKSPVNLERAMAANGRFGGHLVSGHIDGTGQITNLQRDDNAVWYTIKTSQSLMRYIVEKGSIAMDGISLTVAETATETFRVSVIPHTLQKTILADKKPGDIVNLENDIIGKYIEKFMGQNREEDNKNTSNLTEAFLIENGF